MRLPPGPQCNRKDSSSSCLMMEAAACRYTRTRLDLLMMLVLVLRKIQWNGTVGPAIDELLHFRIGIISDFVRRTLRDNSAVTQHNHASGNAKRAGHVMG